jgi:hypothetical protein
MPAIIQKKEKDGGVSEKVYETVAERVCKMREALSVTEGWGLVSEVSYDGELVRVKSSLINPEGKVVATGHAEEDRTASYINKTSAVENCETSAIGRCLFAAGFGGGEFASADELMNALKRQEELVKAGDSVKKGGKKEKDDGKPGKPVTYESLPLIEGVTYTKKDNLVVADGKTFNNKGALKDAGFEFKEYEGGKKGWICQIAA